jgi:hypothetical protein
MPILVTFCLYRRIRVHKEGDKFLEIYLEDAVSGALQRSLQIVPSGRNEINFSVRSTLTLYVLNETSNQLQPYSGDSWLSTKVLN